MIAKAELKFVRGSAKKIRRVIDLIRNLDVNEALSVLSTVNQRPKVAVEKLLKSAISNAKHKGLKEENLYISKIVADGAASWKRYSEAAFGRATEILKRTSHIKIELDLRVVPEAKKASPKPKKIRPKLKKAKV
jgi:large subunit ribosomal protein L22